MFISVVALAALATPPKPAPLQVVWPAGLHVNHLAPNRVTLQMAGAAPVSAALRGVPDSAGQHFTQIFPTVLPWPAPRREATLSGQVFVCEARAVCRMHRFQVAVSASQRGPLHLSRQQITGDLLP